MPPFRLQSLDFCEPQRGRAGLEILGLLVSSNAGSTLHPFLTIASETQSVVQVVLGLAKSVYKETLVKNPHAGISRDVHLARSLWGPLSRPALIRLKELIKRYGLSVAGGDLQYLYEGWYVTHAGLLGLAQRMHCAGIRVQQVREFCEPTVCRWVFKATVYRRRSSKGFVGYGDADPSNVSSLVRGAELRVAETRAVNRALRKAYGIGLCSVEELGLLSGPAKHPQIHPAEENSHSSNGSSNGQPRLRDRLCVLIRQHGLNPSARP